MRRASVLEDLRRYIVQEVLDGREMGLDETTPLLEWGVINSLEIVRLLSFIQGQFNITIEPDQITAEHFSNLGAITDLILTTAGHVQHD